MRISIITTAAVLALAGVTSAQEGKGKGKAAPAEPPAAAPAAKVEATPDNLSYALGIAVGQNLKQNGLKLANPAEFAKAISDVMNDKEPRFTDAQVKELVMGAQKAQMKERMKEQMKEQGDAMIAEQKTRVTKEKEAYEKALAAGDKTVVAARDFLAENAKRKEVKTTASGLQYEVIKPAEGKKPGAKDSFTAHYKGTFLDGKQFDNSFERDEPLTLPLLQVVPGWTEGLQLMPVGSRYKFFVPSYLGYGADGRDGIPGHSPLIFEVELLGIE